jgi:hypothetical protein
MQGWVWRIVPRVLVLANMAQTIIPCFEMVLLEIGTSLVGSAEDTANSARIGTFFGHKGAVYQARLSPDANTAATASADFTA